MGNNDNITEQDNGVAKEEAKNDTNNVQAIDNSSDIAEAKKHSKKGIIIILSVVAIVAICGVSVYAYNWVTEHDLVEGYNNKVYPECYINEVAVGDLTASALEEEVTNIENEIRDKTITVTVDGKEYSTAYWNVDVSVDKDKLEDEVMNYGKDESFSKKVSLINNPEKKSFEVEVTYDEDKINEFVEGIASEVNVDPVNASASITGGALSVVDGSNGYELDKESLIDSIKSQITGNDGGVDINLDGTLNEVEPSITASALQAIDTKVGEFTTNFSVGPSGSNIQTGASYLSNTLLMPGDEFSCTDAIGPTTIDRGFIEANTYVSGQVVKGVGGGVCQIATTVYNAELSAGLLPTERQNHMMTVGYIGIGLDATLADDLIDLKFVNTYDYPLLVVANTTSTSLTVEIWSNSQAKGGHTYQTRVEATDSLHCETYLDEYDENGNFVQSIYLNESNYQPFS